MPRNPLTTRPSIWFGVWPKALQGRAAEARKIRSALLRAPQPETPEAEAAADKKLDRLRKILVSMRYPPEIAKKIAGRLRDRAFAPRISPPPAKPPPPLRPGPRRRPQTEKHKKRSPIVQAQLRRKVEARQAALAGQPRAARPKKAAAPRKKKSKAIPAEGGKRTRKVVPLEPYVIAQNPRKLRRGVRLAAVRQLEDKLRAFPALYSDDQKRRWEGLLRRYDRALRQARAYTRPEIDRKLSWARRLGPAKVELERGRLKYGPIDPEAERSAFEALRERGFLSPRDVLEAG